MGKGVNLTPFIMVGFLMLIIMVAVLFGNVIFANIESEADFTNMTSEQNQSYNATTQITQVGLAGFGVIGWLLVLMAVIVGVVILFRAAW